MTLVLAFAAGLLSILSPCVLPLAPIVVAGARTRDPRGPLALAAGLALTFALVGSTIASFGIELGDTGVVRIVAAAIMVAVGAVMLSPYLGVRSERMLAPLAGWSDTLARRLPARGVIGSFAAGIVLALAWAPCVGPTLGAAVALAASGASLGTTMATMFVYALGAALALLAAGFLVGSLTGRERRLAGATGRFGQAILAVVLVAVGGSILTGFDHAIEAAFATSMPDWLITFATRL